MMDGWEQFVKIWRKIHRFIGPGFSGFPLRWFCEVAKIWGTDSANPLDVDDHKDLGTDQFRFPLTGCSTYFCWPEKSATGDRRRVRDMVTKGGALLGRSDYRQNFHVFWSSLKTKICNKESFSWWRWRSEMGSMLPNVAFGLAGNRNRRLRALIVMIVLIITMRPMMIMMILSVDYFPENTFDFG